MHYITIRVEGFDLQKLLSQCLNKGIDLWNIKIAGDLEMTMRMDASDWDRFLKLARNRYRVTVISEKGFKPLFRRIITKKRTLVGAALFVLLLYYQSSFISEIRVYGYEKLTEREILENLESASLYAGCSKSVDLDKIEIQMFRNIEELSWIGIKLKGNLAEVTVVEGTTPVEEVDKSKPCHIIASKDGYIQKTIARQGKEAVSQGDFVHAGDLLISGILPIEDKTYSKDPDTVLERYVHAEGEIYAKTVYRFIRYQEKEELRKEKTGRRMPGLSLRIGNFFFNSANHIYPYDKSVYEEKRVFGFLRPVPVEFSYNCQWEVELRKIIRDEEAVTKRAKQQLREAIRENIPDSAQILNNSLKFSQEENIIRVIMMVEALEEIGRKQFFDPAATRGNIEMLRED